MRYIICDTADEYFRQTFKIKKILGKNFKAVKNEKTEYFTETLHNTAVSFRLMI